MSEQGDKAWEGYVRAVPERHPLPTGYERVEVDGKVRIREQGTGRLVPVLEQNN